MVDAMRRSGVDTGGRPPVWAWQGVLRLRDATSLFDPQHELVRGFATVELDAPDDLVVLSDYGKWCDYLMAPVGSVGEWNPGALDPHSAVPVQACLPSLRSEWVRTVRPLPTTGWEQIDQERPA